MTILHIVFHWVAFFSNTPPAFTDSPPAYTVSETTRTDTLRLPQRLHADATYLSQYLFNGPRYHIYDRNAKTHQFYLTRDLLTGTLRYDGQDYGPFQMHYDATLGMLVIKQPLHGYLVRLDSAKVEHFTLNNSYFELVSNHPQLKKGIYQTLYEGDIKLICLRKKIRLEKYEDLKVIPIYVDVSPYFFYTGGEYRRIRYKKDIYRLFPEHRKKIRSYFRYAPSSFRGDIEQHLLEIAKIINQPASGI